MYEDKVLSIIEDIVKDSYLDKDIQYDKELYIEILRSIEKNEPITSNIDEIWKESEEYFIFYVNDNSKNNINKGEVDVSVLKKLDEMDKEINYTKIKLYIIFHTIEDKLSFDIKQLKKSISTYMKLKSININSKNIEINTIFIGKIKNRSFKIEINDRIRSLETSRVVKLDEKDNFGLKIKGLVFNASLRDITNIYNILGNELFDKNLRYSIKDELNVDSQIKNTLRTNPEEFWYLNNGITMIIEDDEFKLKRSNSIDIQYKDDKIVSIINGAQTISASAEYFYENNNKNIGAQVMLRVIHISKFGCDNSNKEKLIKLSNKEINKISIALNRQKPIKQEDIAYTTSFVYAINKLSEDYSNEKEYFKISKRSKVSNKGYDLLEFGKLVKSYLGQEPGTALNQTAKKLFALDEQHEFVDKSIFKNELQDENKSVEVFNKYYRPVNFAAKLMNLYSKNAKNMVEKSEIESINIAKNIASYGKYYFIAYIIYVLNKSSNTNFLEFNIDEEYLNNSSYLNDIIMEYIELLAKVIVEKDSEINININNFKNEDIYEYFINYIEEDTIDNELSKSIEAYNKKICEYFGATYNEVVLT